MIKNVQDTLDPLKSIYLIKTHKQIGNNLKFTVMFIYKTQTIIFLYLKFKLVSNNLNKDYFNQQVCN